MPPLQTRLPFTPWADPQMRRLPGIQPLPMQDWRVIDEAFAGQMTLRDRLSPDQRATLDVGPVPCREALQ